MTIRELVESSGMCQSEFARHFDIPYRTLQDWYSGRRTPPPYVIKMIQMILDR